jgi:glyoxylase-like metal-dependent hydrolase (beta-lactamase superfamily II)
MAAGGSGMGDLLSWQIGDVRVTRVVELELASKGTWILPDATPEALRRVAWLRPHFADEDGLARMSVHALLVESQGRRIVVDTCIGNDKERTIPDWNLRKCPFLEDLAAAGFPADSVDTVVCTHLHVDHVGWNTRREGDRWVPTFERARYLYDRGEWEFWSTRDERDFGDVIGDSVRPVFDAGLVDLVEPGHRIDEHVWLEPTPGHTPGHVSVRIASRGEEAVITGDLMHHPVQCAHPEWGSSADQDPEQARSTRRSFLERHGDRPVLVIGTHFAGPTAGHIVRDGDAWRLEA